MGQVRFVAVGDLMLDVLAQGRGHSARIEVAAGGSAANAARAAVACGAEATVIGAVGDDAAGRLLVAELEAAGVRAEPIVLDRARTGAFLVVDGEIRADRGANALLRPGGLPEAIEADVVLVSGYLEPATVEGALERARARWLALAVGRLEELPPAAVAVLANEDEARRLTGLPPDQAARRLGRGRRLACVTLGPEGGTWTVETPGPPRRVDVNAGRGLLATIRRN